MIFTKILDTADLIEEATALLHENYVDKGTWEFSVDNPSKLHIEERHGRKLLLDRFTDSAIWFGAFDQNQLIGCIRLCGPDQYDKFEIEGYTSSHVVMSYIKDVNRKCLEMTRAVVDANYRGLKVLNHLYTIALEYCQKHKLSVFGAANNSHVKALLKRIEFPLKLEQAFKYEEHDTMPVNFYLANYEKGEIKNTINKLKDSHSKSKPYDIFEILKIAAPILPAPVYWHDVNGAVVGLNEHCLKGMGTTEEVIGKTPYDFYPREIAEHILKHNEKIMSTGEILSQEERIEDLTTGAVKYYTAVKAPLYDYDGTVLGIVGTSIDITAEKEAAAREKIALANAAEAHTKAEQQQRFVQIAHQVAHDIRSPLSSLLMIVKFCTEIPEEYRVALREAAISIGDIANNLLTRYQHPEECTREELEQTQDILVSAALLEMLTEKKYQYMSKAIKFDYNFAQLSNFAFIKIRPIAFRRMVSNLINNAVDAFDGKPGKVLLRLEANGEFIRLVIEDSGKGIAPDLLEKIANNISITSGKKNGHGIGLIQVRETLKDHQGEMYIESKLGEGTKVFIDFPRMQAPSWIAEEIHLKEGDTIIILDDDISIHAAWNTHFDLILKDHNNIHLKHFDLASEAIKFIQSLSSAEQEKIFLLTDFELIKQNLTGLDVIAQTKIKRSILVTSHYRNRKVLTKAAKTNTKILPKQLASEIPIVFTPLVIADDIKTEIIMVDDDDKFTKMVKEFIFDGYKVDTYQNPEYFLEHFTNVDKNIPIYLDSNFQGTLLRGMDIAKILHEQGYTRLYLLSGDKFNQAEVPDYLTVLLKGNIEAIENSLSL